MSWLLTGIEGFVGSHLLALLRSLQQDVYGTTWNKELADNKHIFLLNLLNRTEIAKILERVKPQYLVLLAGFSSMRESFEKPQECLSVNYESSRHFLEEIRRLGLKTNVLTISSAMVYCPSDDLLTEDSPLCVSSPYAESKIKQEQLLQEFPEINILSSRSFNHTGPGQRDNFLVPKLVKTFIMTQTEHVELSVGDIDGQRDFLDVRDVCKAYITLLTEKTQHKIYNVCSSKVKSVREIISILEKMTAKKALINIKPELISKEERKIIIGSNQRLIKDTTWRPQITFDQTIADMCEYWRQQHER